MRLWGDLPRRTRGREAGRLAAFAFALALAFFGGGTVRPAERPDILIVTVDTLRADRLSGFGYSRATSPSIDRLVERGVRFTAARTVEPLTTPSLASMLTSAQPHDHGATRNGLRVRPGLASLPKLLQAEGYDTVAFVGNWTLRDKLSGLGEHFGRYDEVFSRKRWFGLVSSETTAEDLTEKALEWLSGRGQDARPFLAWVHYVEPHAPYRAHDEFRKRLGLPPGGNLSATDRYDTEIAFVDHSIGELLQGFERQRDARPLLVVFTSDHGESLGEHGYWGHGRNLYEPGLHIPLVLTWPERIRPGSIEAPALNIDVAPTLAGLLSLPPPDGFSGYDWTRVMDGAVEPPWQRTTRYQSHRGAVLSRHDSDLARRSGLLEVAVLQGNVKEILRLKNGRCLRFDLRSDPAELDDLRTSETAPPVDVERWVEVVSGDLAGLDDAPVEPLDEETAERLRALGYSD